jgi:hypothetical protein
MSTIYEFQSVERPFALQASDPLIAALIETNETGKAIKLTIPLSEVHSWQNKVRASLRDLGYKLSYRYSRKDRSLTAWVSERKEDEIDED